MSDTGSTDDEPEIFDPREGQGVLALWDFVYDFDDDRGGFATGTFLLRADGAAPTPLTVDDAHRYTAPALGS